jgi:hypothetical protein
MKKVLLFGLLISLFVGKAQNVNIPDFGFKSLLIGFEVVDTDGDGLVDSNVDTNNDGEVSVTEAQSVTNLDFINTNGVVMNDIEGIQSFINLESIVNLFGIENADFTNMVNLKRIDAHYFDFGSTTVNTLIITGCNQLEELKIKSDIITNLDLTGIFTLTSMDLDLESITSLDISNQINLEVFEGDLVSINSIDFSNNVNLREISIRNLRFNIRSIDFQNNIELRELYISNTFLNTLDLSLNTNLENMRIDFNRFLTSIDMSSNTLLKELKMFDSPIAAIDLSSNTVFENLTLGKLPNITNNSISFNPAAVLKFISIDEVPSLLNNGELPILHRTGLELVRIVRMNGFTDLNLNNIPDIREVNIFSTGLLNFNASTAVNLEYLSISTSSLNTIDLTSCTNLNSLRLGSIPLSTLDLSANSNLESLNLFSITTPSIDISHMTGLKELYLINLTCNNCSATNLFDLHTNQALEVVEFKFNSLLTSINLTSHPNLKSINFENNNILETVFIKNNFSDPNQLEIPLQTITNPLYICLDEGLEDYVTERLNIFSSVEIIANSYCSFNPGGDFNEILGRTSLDVNNDGCDNTDPNFSNFMLSTFDGTTDGSISTNSMGEFYLPVSDGQYTITPQPENPSYWNFTPNNITVDFPNQSSPAQQDFCVTANGLVEDLEVFVIPLTQARPGFESQYKVLVKNKGNQIAGGSVDLVFQNDFMSLISTTPSVTSSTTNRLSWDFTSLAPFQTQEFTVVMLLNTPTASVNPLMSDDVLLFTGIATGSAAESMPADNTATLNQTVVNSYDPNDKTCLEGKTITPAMVGEYVHYIIRFENTGTASAINVVVKDIIDTDQLDRSTFIPLGGSHDYYTRITENNKIEFIHENINLDFNDATNDGYVLFKIKTLNTLVEGAVFENTADIFFDFNAPIITNTEVVTIMSTASLGETTDSGINIYPVPAKDFINLKANSVIQSADLIDVYGRLIFQTKFTDNSKEQGVELRSLNAGIYFIKIKTEAGEMTQKLILE